MSPRRGAPLTSPPILSGSLLIEFRRAPLSPHPIGVHSTLVRCTQGLDLELDDG
jgi:hypothetical protein